MCCLARNYTLLEDTVTELRAICSCVSWNCMSFAYVFLRENACHLQMYFRGTRVIPKNAVAESVSCALSVSQTDCHVPFLFYGAVCHLSMCCLGALVISKSSVAAYVLYWGTPSRKACHIEEYLRKTSVISRNDLVKRVSYRGIPLQNACHTLFLLRGTGFICTFDFEDRVSFGHSFRQTPGMSKNAVNQIPPERKKRKKTPTPI